MAKSIKPKDDTYIDSTGIVHNKELLSNILNGLAGKFTDINRSDLNSFTSTVVIGYGHNLTNSPLDNLNQGHLISVPRHDAEGFVTQYFSPYPTNDVYIRKCEDGAWGKWVLITNNYSSNEVCIGTWFGKPLYRKTINFGTLGSNTTKNVAHNITNVEQWVDIRAVTQNKDKTALPIPATNTSALTYGINITVTTTEVRIQTGMDRTSFSAYAILEYTKTTD